MTRLTCITLLAALIAFAGNGRPAAAEDVYYVKPLRDLEIMEGALPKDFDQSFYLGPWRNRPPLQPAAGS